MNERYPGEESQRIVLWFVPEEIPQGGAPEEVRQQWIGVPLPVRGGNVANPADLLAGL